MGTSYYDDLFVQSLESSLNYIREDCDVEWMQFLSKNSNIKDYNELIIYSIDAMKYLETNDVSSLVKYLQNNNLDKVSISNILGILFSYTIYENMVKEYIKSNEDKYALSLFFKKSV